jgi:flagellar motor switch protein FliG
MVSSILCLLPDEKVSPTLGYMVEAPKIDPSIEPAVERMIEIEFLNKDQDVSENNDDHLGVIGEVLSLIPAQKRNNLIDFLRTSHEAKLPIIEKGLFTIDALPEILPRNTVNVVFRQIDNAVMVKLLASLRDTYPPILEFLLTNISSRMADSMREEFKDMPAFSVDQVETLQREFLTTLMDLSRRGLITMNRATDKNDEASVPLPG